MLFGSQELQETANYTLQALEAVMTGVFNLAEHLTQKTQDLSNTISNLDQEVNYVSALASQYQGRCFDKTFEYLDFFHFFQNLAYKKSTGKWSE